MLLERPSPDGCCFLSAFFSVVERPKVNGDAFVLQHLNDVVNDVVGQVFWRMDPSVKEGAFDRSLDAR